MRPRFMIMFLVGAACGDHRGTQPDAAATKAAATKAAPAAVTDEAPDTDAEPARAVASAAFNPRLLRRFKPLRTELATQPRDQAQIELGRMLYFDPRLSGDGTVSCNSCHPLARYGADGEPTSIGIRGQRGVRNAPSTFHAAGLVAQFWDGRAPDVEAQAPMPMTNPAEMGATEEQIVATLTSIPGYRTAFAAAFPDQAKPITLGNVGQAIGAFERGLVTPARWDAFLGGDKAALTAEEVEGLRVFTNAGCMVCHTGEFVGGSSFQPLGAVEAWPNQDDRGRTAVTQNDSDDMVFRVPSLRNVAETGPYFHDGSARTLDDAVRMMARYQLGVELSRAERAAIVAWLKSLTGPLPAAYIAAPTLPPSAPVAK